MPLYYGSGKGRGDGIRYPHLSLNRRCKPTLNSLAGLGSHESSFSVLLKLHPESGRQDSNLELSRLKRCNPTLNSLAGLVSHETSFSALPLSYVQKPVLRIELRFTLYERVVMPLYHTGVEIVPPLFFRCFDSVALNASHLTFRHFLKQGLQRPTPVNGCGHLQFFDSCYVIELQKERIGFPAVHAGVCSQMFQNHQPISVCCRSSSRHNSTLAVRRGFIVLLVTLFLTSTTVRLLAIGLSFVSSKIIQ